MKLALKAVPYRALQKTTTLVISAVFLTSIGVGFGFGLPQLLAVAGGGFLAMLAYEIAYYRRFRYELTADSFDIRSGVFNRREREIPYGRIQNVDISRNVLQRLVGLSQLDIETAGGGSTEATLRYVTAFEAKRLQLDIRRYKRGETPETATGPNTADANADDPHADDELLFEIAPSELALAGILSFDPRVPGAIIALFTGSVPFVSPIIPVDAPPLIFLGLLAVLFAAGIVLAWIVGALSAVVNFWGFRLTRAEDELRYERGLLQRYSGTIPFDKIQSVTITDNPLKRRAGYATLVVETAGYAPGQADGRGSEAAVPIGSRDRVDRLADEIGSGEQPEFNRPPKRIRRRYLVRYLLAIGALTGVVYAVATLFNAADAMPWYLPAVAAVLTPVAAHYKWVHRGYWLGEDQLFTRNGFWSRETKQVAYYRIQTVIDTRTIFQRRWTVATVIADTAGSLSVLGTGAAAVDIDQRSADRLREELTNRLRTALAARRRARRQQSESATGRDTPAAAGEDRNDADVDDSPNSDAVDDPDSDAVDDPDSHNGDDASDGVNTSGDDASGGFDFDPEVVDGHDDDSTGATDQQSHRQETNGQDVDRLDDPERSS